MSKMGNRAGNRLNWARIAQLFVVLVIAYGLKSYYAAASPEQLRWILAPTTLFVELVSGTSFYFESHAGYLSADRTFLIAGSCAGVNFLITAFLMLSLRRLWNNRSTATTSKWEYLLVPVAASSAYGATLVANTVRICVALQMRQMSFRIDGLSANELHRLEGIFVYFGFLLLLFVITEQWREHVLSDTAARPSTLLRQSLFPLLIYYLTTLGIPLANLVNRGSNVRREFWEHSLFVLLTPLPLILILAAWSALATKKSRTSPNEWSGHAALPPGVRKASGLPEVRSKEFGLRPVFRAQPRLLGRLTEARSASAHRTAEPRISR